MLFRITWEESIIVKMLFNHMISLICGINTNELTYKAETYSTDTKNKLLITKEKGGGRRIK